MVELRSIGIDVLPPRSTVSVLAGVVAVLVALPLASVPGGRRRLQRARCRIEGHIADTDRGARVGKAASRGRIGLVVGSRFPRVVTRLGQVDVKHVGLAERVVSGHRSLVGVGCVGLVARRQIASHSRRRRRQVRRQRAGRGGLSVERGRRDVDDREARRHATRGLFIAHELVAGGVDEIAFRVGHERAGAGEILALAVLADDEEAVAIDAEIRRRGRRGQRALAGDAVAHVGLHAAGLVFAGCVDAERRLEFGGGLLVAGGARVGDVVADRAQRIALRLHAGRGGTHRVEQAHGRGTSWRVFGTVIRRPEARAALRHRSPSARCSSRENVCYRPDS